eukprot:464349-Amphidinium_carterae.4
MHGRLAGAGGVRSSLERHGCNRAHASCQELSVAGASGRLFRQRQARRPAPARTARYRRCACVALRDSAGVTSVGSASCGGKAAGSAAGWADGSIARR